MIALDTNVLVYVYDSAEPVKRERVFTSRDREGADRATRMPECGLQ